MDKQLRQALDELVDTMQPCHVCEGTGNDPTDPTGTACDRCGGYGETCSDGAAIDLAVLYRSSRAKEARDAR